MTSLTTRVHHLEAAGRHAFEVWAERDDLPGMFDRIDEPGEPVLPRVELDALPTPEGVTRIIVSYATRRRS